MIYSYIICIFIYMFNFIINKSMYYWIYLFNILYICRRERENVCEQHPVYKNIEVKTRNSTQSRSMFTCLIYFKMRPSPVYSRSQQLKKSGILFTAHSTETYYEHWILRKKLNKKTPLHFLNKKICRELTWRSKTSKCVFTLLKIFTVQWAFFKNQSWWDCAKMWVELCWGNKVNKVWHLKETQT